MNIDYKIVFEDANDAIFIEDLDGNIIEVNKKACELFGYSREEFLKLTAADLVPENVKQKFPDIVKILKKNKYLTFRTQNITKTGKLLDVDVSLRLLTFEDKDLVLAIVRDISDLVELQNNYKTLAELSQNVILVHDGEEILFANRKLYEVAAVPNDTKIDINYLLSFVDPEPRKLLIENIKKRLKGETVPNKYEITGKNLDGEPMNLLVYGQKITYNRKPAILVNFVDITRFRQMEKKLRFLNNLLKAISGVNQLIVREKDPSKMLSGAAKLLKGVKNYWEVFYAVNARDKVILPPEDQIDSPLHPLWELFNRGETPALENPLFITDIKEGDFGESGELNFLKSIEGGGAALVPISYRGENYGILCVFTKKPNPWIEEERKLLMEVAEDLGFAISLYILEREKKVALRKLAQSEYLYKTLVETAPLAIALHDGERFVFVNPEFLKMTGYENIEELKNKELAEFLAPESREDARITIEEMLRTGEPVLSVEEIGIRKDGSRIYVELAAAPVVIDGKPHILALAKDITQRKLAEQEARALEEKLLQAQKLEAIGRLAGGIAHEFNNLLNGIIGYAELLKENLSVSSPAFRYAELILKTGLDAAKLTRQILSFSRKAPRENKPFFLNDAVNEVVELVRQTAPRNVEITTELDPRHLVVQGDIAQIEQVIMNLCVNGIDAMPQGGKLTLKTDVVESGGKYSGLPAGQYALLVVEDTGTGMPPEILEKIFDPFFTTKEPGEGTGLGLSIAYSIVHEHGGHIYVESQVGKGSRFEVLLPLAEAKPKSGGEQISAAKHGGAATILVADDEPVLLALLVDLLQSRGYRVLTAANGIEAVELYRKHADEIDLVLLDILMPKMDGVETIKEIMKINPQAKVMVISGFAQMDKVDSCLEAGAVGFIKKPFRISELSDKIWAALNE